MWQELNLLLSQIMCSAAFAMDRTGEFAIRASCRTGLVHLQVLFYLSWRLGPILALVIIATAAAAANYKKQTKLVEGTASKALSDMVGVADQAFRAITTVRCAGILHPKRPLQQARRMSMSYAGCVTCKLRLLRNCAAASISASAS